MVRFNTASGNAQLQPQLNGWDNEDPFCGFNTASGNAQLQQARQKQNKKERDEVSIPQAVMPSCNNWPPSAGKMANGFQYRKR